MKRLGTADSPRPRRRVGTQEDRLAEVRFLADSVPTPLAYVDRDGLCRYVNKACLEWTGLSASQLEGKSVEEMLGGPALSAARPFITRTLAGERVRFRGQLYRSGELRQVDVTCTPHLADDGGVHGYAALIEDVTGRGGLAEELAHSHDELRRANADLEQFAWAAAHDLQEPLRTLSLYNELIGRRYHDKLDSDANSYLQVCVEASRRMQALVSDLLTYTRLQPLSDPAGRVKCDAVVAAVRSRLAPDIEATVATVDVQRLPTVRAHAQHVEQLFLNLISNAIKYKPADRPPYVRIWADEGRDGMVRFHVADNGPGIPPPYHQRIFGVFKRLHGRDVPGTGIGLAVCRKVVELYGGTISVASEGNGSGSVFTFTLPRY